MTPLARSALLTAFVVTALPALAVAEGNRLVLTCDPLTPAADEARAGASRASFTIAPVKTARDGSGPIEATGPDGTTAAGVAASHTGPFAWTAGTVLNTLTLEGSTADGRTLVLWHRLDQAQAAVPPAGELTKLLCEAS